MALPLSSVKAPAAPGRLGEPVDVEQMQAYLQLLDEWLRARRDELDQLDEAAMRADRGGEADRSLTSDLTLSMAIWKAVSDRNARLLEVWDGGRVLRKEREQLASLLWGRLDEATAGGLQVSLPEACRLSDALAGQLRVKLAFDPAADAQVSRVKAARAAIERLRDQLALEPAGVRAQWNDRWTSAAARVADLSARAQRGADIGGLIGPLEHELARMERDLIVGNAQRREALGALATARSMRASLEKRQADLTALVERTVRTVTPAPRYAIPDVAALGPVPATPAAINEYLDKLERVSHAIGFAEQEYREALDEHSDLVALLDALVVKARGLGVADHDDVLAAEKQARAVLNREPCPMPLARQLVTTYQSWTDTEGRVSA
ncbi:MAG: hypothetical protein GXY39_00225 [Actinomycetales bacterium]|nr:hypothetical protein [Tetrasphaera sp.]NLW98109.1 hypothetical protein [Actinomycetales bacterium]